MSDPRDESQKLRGSQAQLVNNFSQGGRDPAMGMPCLVAQTKAISSYPTTAPSFFGCLPLTVLGQEVEGGSGGTTLGLSTFLALNLGSAIPPVGTNLLVTFVDNRWVFRFDG